MPNVSTDLTSYNQWIWEIPFDAYSPAQQPTCGKNGGPCIQFISDTTLPPNFSNTLKDAFASIQPLIPIPFGFTEKLQAPTVTSVDHTSIPVGCDFTITGTAFYPALVEAVLIGGQQAPGANVNPLSDT